MLFIIPILILFLQVLSESVSKALQLTGGPEAEETARFVGMMDKMFDCLNVNNSSAGIHKCKPFKFPYRGSDDFRLKVSGHVTTMLSSGMQE